VRWFLNDSGGGFSCDLALLPFTSMNSTMTTAFGQIPSSNKAKGENEESRHNGGIRISTCVKQKK